MAGKVGDKGGKSWICFRCRRGFVHARTLVSHLIDVHNLMPSK